MGFKVVTVKVEVSARHLHLTQAAIDKLFGKGYKIHKLKDISQKGQFASREVLQVKGAKGKIDKVRIVGPTRPYCQFELSVSDCRSLGIKPTLRVSGDVKNAPLVTVVGPKGRVKVPAIVAWRHLHIPPSKAKELGLNNKQIIKVRIGGDRGLVFDKVVVRVHPTFRFRLHLDTDEGNASLVQASTKAELLI